jgi:putative transposase
MDGVIHHSGRGSQYASLAFGRTLRESGLLASMGSKGDPLRQAMCESCLSTLKEELQTLYVEDARASPTRRLHLHRDLLQPRRRHSSLGYLSPDEYEKMIKIENSNDPQTTTTC